MAILEECKVHKAYKDLLEISVHKVCKVMQAYKVQLDTKVLLAPKVELATCLDRKVALAHKVCKAILDIKAFKEMLVVAECKETKD